MRAIVANCTGVIDLYDIEVVHFSYLFNFTYLKSSNFFNTKES